VSEGGLVRLMEEADLERVLSWRNHSEVRRWMYTTHEIGVDEHRRWFEGASEDPGRHLLVYECDGVPMGFVNLHQLRGEDVAEWGFYLAPGAPRGSGRGLGVAALDHAFDALGLHKVSGHALEGNERSISFHLRLGFRDEGLRHDQHLDTDGVRHSVACFGLSRDEWPAARVAILEGGEAKQ
jgi:UDP-4-amino-4,6-dideoxy-N-acetyl-beta-L-altrosamine N-acetyltransferase